AINGYLLHRLGYEPEAAAWRRTLLRPLAERVLVAWCGLHSDHSGAIEATLTPPASAAPSILRLAARSGVTSEAAIQHAARRLARLALRSGTLALTPMLQTAPIGGGNHLGGCLPMRRHPTGRWDTDTLGRLQRWQRVHFVDGAVLPAIPATTLALTIMANADRIATAAPLGNS